MSSGNVFSTLLFAMIMFFLITRSVQNHKNQLNICSLSPIETNRRKCLTSSTISKKLVGLFCLFVRCGGRDSGGGGGDGGGIVWRTRYFDFHSSTNPLLCNDFFFWQMFTILLLWLLKRWLKRNYHYTFVIVVPLLLSLCASAEGNTITPLHNVESFGTLTSNVWLTSKLGVVVLCCVVDEVCDVLNLMILLFILACHSYEMRLKKHQQEIEQQKAQKGSKWSCSFTHTYTHNHTLILSFTSNHINQINQQNYCNSNGENLFNVVHPTAFHGRFFPFFSLRITVNSY